MRIPALAVVVATFATGCVAHDRPYRFRSPMLGTAAVPEPPLPGEKPPPEAEGPRRERPGHREARAIRVATAPKIREASAAAAARVASTPSARPEARAELAAPHRLPADAPLPAVRTFDDLRALVGRRDARDPIAAALAWTRELGIATEGATGAELVTWAEHGDRLAAPTAEAGPGDLLVFDHVSSDDTSDLVAIVLSRDARGVTEFVYVGGGVIRRGFVDASRPSLRRDKDGAIVNTFMRHGRRWPAKGSRYLAGELLASIVRTR